MYLIKIDITTEWFLKEQSIGRYINYQSNLLNQLEKGELSTKTGFFTRSEYLNSIQDAKSQQSWMQKSFLDVQEQFLFRYPLIFTNLSKLHHYLDKDEFFRRFDFGNLDYYYLRRQLASRQGLYSASAEHPDRPGQKMLKLNINRVSANPEPILISKKTGHH